MEPKYLIELQKFPKNGNQNYNVLLVLVLQKESECSFLSVSFFLILYKKHNFINHNEYKAMEDYLPITSLQINLKQGKKCLKTVTNFHSIFKESICFEFSLLCYIALWTMECLGF